MQSRDRENGVGVWVIACGGIDHLIAARTVEEAEAWFIQRTGLAPFEYGSLKRVEDLDRIKVTDNSKPSVLDDEGRHIFDMITAREAIRRAKSFPTELV